MISLDIYAKYITQDTSGGIIPLALAYYGIKSVQDIYLQVLQYLESMILGFIGIKIDTTNNIVAQLIGGKFKPDTC